MSAVSGVCAYNDYVYTTVFIMCSDLLRSLKPNRYLLKTHILCMKDVSHNLGRLLHSSRSLKPFGCTYTITLGFAPGNYR